MPSHFKRRDQGQYQEVQIVGAIYSVCFILFSFRPKDANCIISMIFFQKLWVQLHPLHPCSTMPLEMKIPFQLGDVTRSTTTASTPPSPFSVYVI